MSAYTKARTTKELTEIRLEVSVRDAARVRQAIGGMLALVGRGARLLGEGEIKDDAIYSFEEAFSDSTPGRRLRGLRTREGITQRELAEKLDIHQHHVSEMESGAQKIGLVMAKRIAKAYDISHRVFLQCAFIASEPRVVEHGVIHAAYGLWWKEKVQATSSFRYQVLFDASLVMARDAFSVSVDRFSCSVSVLLFSRP